MVAATTADLADAANPSIILPGLRVLVSLLNGDRPDPQPTKVWAAVVKSLVGREPAGAGDLAAQFWNCLDPQQKEYLHQILPERKKAELVEKALASKSRAPLINPYHAFVAPYEQRLKLFLPDFSLNHFNIFQTYLPGLNTLAGLLAHQDGLLPVSAESRGKLVSTEERKIERDTGKRIIWERDSKAGIYEQLDQESRKKFHNLLPRSLRDRTDAARNLYLKPTSFATDEDIFVTDLPIPSICPAGIDVERMTDEFDIEEWLTPDAFPDRTPEADATTSDATPKANQPTPATFTPINQIPTKTTPASNSDEITPTNTQPDSPKLAGAMAPKPTVKAPKQTGNAVPKPARQSARRKGDSDVTPGPSVYAPVTQPAVSKPTAASKPAENTEDDTKGDEDGDDNGDGQEDEYKSTSGPIQQISHPPFTGQPGKAIDKEGSRPGQERWTEWPLFDRWKDYDNGQIPPPFVRLDDWNVWKTVDHCLKVVRVERWPADFDREGNIRRTRANYGNAAKLQDSDGLFKYMIFKTYYQLLGQEGQASSLLRLLGPIPKGSDARSPYFRYGDNCLGQSPSPPINVVMPAQQPIPPQTGKPARSSMPQQPVTHQSTTYHHPPVPPAPAMQPVYKPVTNQPATYDYPPPPRPDTVIKRAHEADPTSYFAKRQKGEIDIEDGNDAESELGTVDRSEAMLKAVLQVTRGSLVTDEEIASRLQAQADALVTYVGLGQNLLDYTRDTARIVADRLLNHLPAVAQHGLSEEDAAQVQETVHHIHRLVVDGNLHRAPIGSSPQRVLDIGTGTGIWAIEFGDEHPNAEVIGMDLSPIQPSWVPPNVKFEVDDAESEWPYNAPFDYIHGRSLCGAIGDWDKLFGQALQHLKPGGWMESQEYEVWFHSDDGTLEKLATNCVEYQERLDEASEKFGKKMNSVRTLEGKMNKAGFEDVKSDVYKVPLSPWAKDKKLKELGRYQQIATLDSLEPYGLALFTRILGWTPEQVNVLLAGVRKELKDPRIHIYCKIHFIYGRKPTDK